MKELVDGALDGRDCSFFVYGQTGSGKTHTITGSDKESGVVQLSMAHIDRVKKSIPDLKIMISSFEVYKEQIYDLLGKQGYNKPLKISEKLAGGGFEISGLSEVEVSSLEEMVQVLSNADHQRHFAETYLEHLSSRSHMGFRIYLTQHAKKGSVTFIDLAGCEKIKAYSESARSTDFGQSCSPARNIE